MQQPDAAPSTARLGDSPTQPNRRRVLALAGAIALYVVVTAIGHHFSVWHGYVDLEVYRAGARVWLDGKDLYGPLPPVEGDTLLPFTYPPLAALFFVPLALLPKLAAQWVVFASSVIALALVLAMVLRRLRPRMDAVELTALVIAAVAVFQFVEPVRTTLGYGQINLVLMLVIAADVLVRKPWWPRGLLIGIAVSIKLTPAAFILYFILRRDYRAAATMVAGTIGAIAVGFLVLPSASRQYWLHTLVETDRIGDPHFANNQSLKGFAARLHLPETQTTIIWLGLSLIALVLAVIWMRRLFAAREYLAALLVNALLVLLISPVSWTHHWVWIAPALVVAINAIISGLRNRWFIAATVISCIVFTIGPTWLLPRRNGREFGWAWWQFLLGNSYLIIGVAVLIAGVVCSRPGRPDPASRTVGAPAA